MNRDLINAGNTCCQNLRTILVVFILTGFSGFLFAKNSTKLYIESGGNLCWLIDKKEYIIPEDDESVGVNYGTFSTQPYLSPTIGLSMRNSFNKNVGMHSSIMYSIAKSKLELQNLKILNSYQFTSASLLGTFRIYRGMSLESGPQVIIPIGKLKRTVLLDDGNITSRYKVSRDYIPGIECGLSFSHKKWQTNLNYIHSLKGLDHNLPNFYTRSITLIIGYEFYSN